MGMGMGVVLLLVLKPCGALQSVGIQTVYVSDCLYPNKWYQSDLWRVVFASRPMRLTQAGGVHVPTEVGPLNNKLLTQYKQ